MPRIPVIDAPSVNARPVGTNYSNLNHDTGSEALSRGLASIDEANARVAKAREAAKQRADVTQVTEAEAALTRDANAAMHGDADAAKRGASIPGLWGVDATDGKKTVAMPNGYMALRGKAAMEASTQTLEFLEKRRAEIEASLINPEQKQLFRLRSGGLVETARKQVNHHFAAQQRVAEEAATQARAAEAMRGIAFNYDNDEVAEKHAVSVEGPIRALASTPEEGEMKVAAFRAAAVKARLDQYLANNRIAEAEQLYEREKGRLGTDADEYAKKFGPLKVAGNAEHIAEGLINHPKLRMENGRFNMNEALKQIDAHIPADNVELRDEAKRRLRDRVLFDDKKWDEDTKEISRQAFGSYNTGGWRGIPETLKQDLNRRDPSLYNRLKEDSEQRYRRWKAEKDGDTAARQRQKEMDRLALLQFMQLPAEERAKADVQELYLGRNVSEVGLAAIGVKKREAQTSVEKGMAAAEGEFIREASASAGTSLRGDALKTYEAEARIAYNDHIRRTGKEPTLEEGKRIIQELLLRKPTRPRFGESVLGKGEESEFQRRARERREAQKSGAAEPAAKVAPPATPAGKKVRHKATGRVGTWDGVSPLPDGFEVIDG